MGNAVEDVGQMAAEATVNLAGDILERAISSVESGARLANKVGNLIEEKTRA